MKEYETYHLVKGEDLNHHGTLFAARAAAWLVEAGFVAAACEHGNNEEVVMRNLHDMSFSKPIQKGTIVKFVSRVVYAGCSSMIVSVLALDAMSGEVAVEGYITFVTVDCASGKKKTHEIVLDDTDDAEELRRRTRAKEIRG